MKTENADACSGANGTGLIEGTMTFEDFKEIFNEDQYDTFLPYDCRLTLNQNSQDLIMP